MGRLAVQVALLLMGKTKPIYHTAGEDYINIVAITDRIVHDLRVWIYCLLGIYIARYSTVCISWFWKDLVDGHM